jgi:hypothetical protein
MKYLMSTWTYTVNGEAQGDCTEQYARNRFSSAKLSGLVTDLIRVDHYRSGDGSIRVPTTVESFGRDDLATDLGERAYDMAVVADEAAHRYDTEWDGQAGPYRRDAAYLLLGMLGAAQRRGELADVVRGFDRLASLEPDRLHRLLLSLKGDRTADVISALIDY